ncbi:hypothetical protein LEN26_002800 [Aphanomyces euteiches]|uniref:Transmembrane protein 184C n=1 Tax=Aphanomyces euteiches TaxID=100861 RepID=A0A6G0XUV7_9STRA|nr:hypothetical protein Ae201684_000919 [Aphanomyces euteiches]KAH9102368.1 hypothetical protein AeMF1_021059 [Aphanomyces euteiches]KAH9141534.1 hypothetical protein AeRB84_014314 [Aphanomyces euteiches]KAH9158713.1 hypothetical protein LEN26_002800 [Aphanomyces euteiches]KAH9195703.1 hypothetical protein AeNC1_002340 [Aphanomyces euteiches]
MVSGVFVLVALYVSVKLIRNHLKYFTKPGVQRKIIGILWMVPIYATTSWLSLRFKSWSLLFDMMRDCYEAYVIYLFLALMVAYLGDGSDERVVRILMTLPDLPHPFPFNYWNKPIKMDSSFLRDCKMAAMQFVVLKPLTGFLAILLEHFDLYAQGEFVLNRGYLYISIILNASVTYAFYYLVLFYLALGTHLKPYKPVPKFLCVKAVLFLSYWQSVVLAFLSKFEIIHQVGSWTTNDVTMGIQNVLICFEMMVIAFVHTHAFPYDEYKDYAESLETSSLRDSILSENFAFDDAVRDFNEVMPIVLPSGFKPSSNTRRSEKVIAPGVKLPPKQVTPVAYKNTKKTPLEPVDADRGWKL